MARLTDTRVAALKPPKVGQAEYPDDLVIGLRLRVGAGGRKSWIVRTRAGTKVLNKTLGSYPTIGVGKAREEARKFLQDLAKTGAPRVNRTFGQLAEDWLNKVAKPNNRPGSCKSDDWRSTFCRNGAIANWTLSAVWMCVN